MAHYSSNVRWMDCTDMLREEGNVDDDAPDPDEEVQLVGRTSRRAARDSMEGVDSDSSEDYEMEEEADSAGAPV